MCGLEPAIPMWPSPFRPLLPFVQNLAWLGSHHCTAPIPSTSHTTSPGCSGVNYWQVSLRRHLSHSLSLDRSSASLLSSSSPLLVLPIPAPRVLVLVFTAGVFFFVVVSLGLPSLAGPARPISHAMHLLLQRQQQKNRCLLPRAGGRASRASPAEPGEGEGSELVRGSSIDLPPLASFLPVELCAKAAKSVRAALAELHGGIRAKPSPAAAAAR